MNFRERKINYENLKGVSHLEADRTLLKSLDPGHSLLIKKGKPEKLQPEILWELLGRDNVTSEMVVKNRRKMQGPTEAELKKIAEKCGKISADIQNVATLEEKTTLVNEVKELVKDLPEATASKMIEFAESIIPDFVKKEEAETQLLEMDVTAAPQKDMAKIVRALKLNTKDMKGGTIRPVLVEYKNQLLEKKKSHSDQVIDQMNTENEDLKEANEQLESDKEELEEQNEELQEQLEEAEKKNIPENKQKSQSTQK